MLLPFTVTTSAGIASLAATVVFCAKDRKTTRAPTKNASGKSGKGAKGKAGQSSKSKKSASKSTRSASKKSSQKSTRSSKSKKGASKSSKSSKKLAADAQKKLESSTKSASTKTATTATATTAPSGFDPVPHGTVEKSKASVDAHQLAASERGTKSVVEEVDAIKHTQSMNVAPAKLEYQSVGGVQRIEIKNSSNERKAYKLKCSDNQLYRVNPVFGFAEPHSITKVDVLRFNGEEKMDKLVVLTAKSNGEADPREIFKRENLEREMMVVPLFVH